jgi:carbon-monoxide dehydrogenase medium subunit
MPPLLHRPTTIEEAVTLLSATEGARPLAGGQTLVAMMNSDLIAPAALVSLRRIGALRAVDAVEPGLRIGAMVPHAVLEADSRLDGAWALLREAAAQIAHPAIRTCGTIGGAIAHGDPNADYPTALTALGATVETAGPKGWRPIAIDAFFLDYFTTALESGELVTAVLLPRWPQSSVGVYEKFARVDGDYATVSVALAATFDRHICAAARIAIGSCGAVPLRLDDSDRLLAGTGLDRAAALRAGRLLAEAADPVDDVRGSAELRRKLIPRLLLRACERARAKAGLP